MFPSLTIYVSWATFYSRDLYISLEPRAFVVRLLVCLFTGSWFVATVNASTQSPIYSGAQTKQQPDNKIHVFCASTE